MRWDRSTLPLSRGVLVNVDVVDAVVDDVPVEPGLELGPVVGLDRVDLEGQASPGR